MGRRTDWKEDDSHLVTDTCPCGAASVRFSSSFVSVL